jgi:hypothetical protein
MDKEALRIFLEEELGLGIYLNPQGSLVYDSRFEREFKAIQGDIDLLLDCCADNIYEEEDDGEFVEGINFGAAMKDYFESVESEDE